VASEGNASLKAPTAGDGVPFGPGAFQRQVAPLLAETEASANAHDTDGRLAVLPRDSTLVFVVNGEFSKGWDARRERPRQRWKDGEATGVCECLGEPTCDVACKDLGLTAYLMAARASLPDGQVRDATWRPPRPHRPA
jgi:hypothetical protein